MWFLPLFVVLAGGPTPPLPGMPLPEAIRTTLDQEYPGWKLAPVKREVQQAFNKHHTSRLPSLIAGDFNHDGHWDFAVQIALTAPGQEEQIVIVFLARPGAYEETIVQSMGLDPNVYLWIKNKSVSETGASGQDVLVNKDVLMVLGSPAGDSAYAYTDGKFQEVKIDEDSEHPDPAIPRPPIAP